MLESKPAVDRSLGSQVDRFLASKPPYPRLLRPPLLSAAVGKRIIGVIELEMASALTFVILPQHASRCQGLANSPCRIA